VSLFRAKKRLTTFDRNKDDYYKHVYIRKPLFEAVEFLAKVNRRSRMRVTNDLLELGISEFLAREISEHNRKAVAAREQGATVSPSRFILMFRRWAKSKGKEISKFI
jgi:hypothetical protein